MCEGGLCGNAGQNGVPAGQPVEEDEVTLRLSSGLTVVCILRDDCKFLSS